MNKIGLIAVVALAAWTGAVARTIFSVQPVADVKHYYLPKINIYYLFNKLFANETCIVPNINNYSRSYRDN